MQVWPQYMLNEPAELADMTAPQRSSYAEGPQASTTAHSWQPLLWMGSRPQLCPARSTCNPAARKPCSLTLYWQAPAQTQKVASGSYTTVCWWLAQAAGAAFWAAHHALYMVMLVATKQDRMVAGLHCGLWHDQRYSFKQHSFVMLRTFRFYAVHSISSGKAVDSCSMAAPCPAGRT